MQDLSHRQLFDHAIVDGATIHPFLWTLRALAQDRCCVARAAGLRVSSADARPELRDDLVAA